MSERANKLLAEAMDLSPDERAELVDRLMALSPDDALDADDAAEIERRARRAREQPDGGEAWETVRDRLRTRFAPG